MKLDYSLAPPEFDDVIKVLQHSAETGKYGRDDWLNGKNFDQEKSISSIKRHIKDYREGVRVDSDNGLHPMLMVACRALMQYTLDVREQKTEQMVNKNQEADLYDLALEVEHDAALNGDDWTDCGRVKCVICSNKAKTSGISDLWDIWLNEDEDEEKDAALNDMEDIINSARLTDQAKNTNYDSAPSVKRTKANTAWIIHHQDDFLCSQCLVVKQDKYRYCGSCQANNSSGIVSSEYEKSIPYDDTIPQHTEGNEYVVNAEDGQNAYEVSIVKAAAAYNLKRANALKSFGGWKAHKIHPEHCTCMDCNLSNL